MLHYVSTFVRFGYSNVCKYHSLYLRINLKKTFMATEKL